MAEKIITLLVEDDAGIAKLVHLGLRNNPEIAIQHVMNGDAAIQWLDQHRPDLILLDLNLPGPDGWEVLDFAKAKYGSHQFKVIVVTARRDPISRATGDMHHVDAYLIKPYTVQQLQAVIQEVMKPSPQEDEQAYASVEYDEE